MRSDKKKVLTNSLLYTSGNILLKFFSFLLIPLYTAYLTPDQYGIVNLALGFVNVFSCIMMGGLQFAVIRFYADLKHNLKEVAIMIGTVISIIAIFGVVCCILLLISHKLWQSIIFDNIPFLPVGLLAILISLVTALYNVYQDILKGMQKAKKSVVLSYIFFFILLGSNIYTVVIIKIGATGILLSTFLVNLLMTFIMFIDLRRNGLLKLGIDRVLLKKLLKYSLPLVPHTLAYNVSTFFSRIIINTKMTTSMLGLYSLATQFGGVADVVSNSVQSAFQPWMFSKLNEKKDDHNNFNEIKSLTHQLLWIYGLIYLGIGLFAKDIINFMTNVNYHSAWQYVPFLIMAVAIKSPLYFYLNFLYYNKEKTRYIFFTTVVGSISNMLLTWWFVPLIGIYGAILAEILALIIRTVITLYYTFNDAKHVYSLLNIIFINFITILIFAIAVIPSYLNIFHNNIHELIYKIAFILAYCGILGMIFGKSKISQYKQKNV